LYSRLPDEFFRTMNPLSEFVSVIAFFKTSSRTSSSIKDLLMLFTMLRINSRFLTFSIDSSFGRVDLSKLSSMVFFKSVNFTIFLKLLFKNRNSHNKLEMSQQNTFHIKTMQKSLFEGYKMIRIVEFPDFLEDIGN